MKLLLVTLCAAGLWSPGISAQNKPDFSGTWTMDLSRSEAAAQGPSIGPVTVAIRQTPSEIHIETTQNGTAQVVRYLPDWVKPGTADEAAGTFRWEGSQLVTNLATYINKQAVTLMEVRRLNPAGTEMTVTLTLAVQHGYDTGASSAPGAKNYPNTATGTNVFLKAR